MSVNNTLSNALSGLVAASRAAEVVSANISNAMTDGYGIRELQLSALSLDGTGAGVKVEGISRVADIGLITDRRAADAGHGSAQTATDFYKSVESIIGLPGDDGSLGDRIATFESSLIEASSRPDSQPRLVNVLRSAEGVAEQINTISNEIQSKRQDADKLLHTEVERLNTFLKHIETLNRDVRLQNGGGRDASSLMDQRQQMIDKIASLVPISELPREHGEIALITTGGAILLDGKAAQFTFEAVGVITPDMTVQSGALSKLYMNGELIDTTKNFHAMAGGKLAEVFKVRDVYAVEAQAAIDGVARDIIERFQDPATDPTLSIGDPGIFTDLGNSLNAADEVGLAGRLQVNAAIDPGNGGEIWRLRSGLNAASPGDVGDSQQLTLFAKAIALERVPPSGGFISAPRSASGLASDLLSRMASERESADANLGYAATKLTTLQGLELQNGVDTDHEMQELLLIEQAYAANARVVQAVDKMIEQLLGL